MIVFIISSNIAWLNPAPGKESYQPNPKIPIFWQYNYDSGIEILTAAYFPKIFIKDTTRIDRPTYPLIANLLGKISCLFVCHFYELSELEKAGIGYIVLKLLIYSLALFCLNEILLAYLEKKEIIFSNFLIFFSIISIGNMTLFHTIELQFITPIFIIYLYLNIIKNYSISKNIFFSILVGILMLGKPNYAIYLSIIIFSIYNKKYIESLISFISHFIPFIFYNFYLFSISLKFNFTGSESGQIIWFKEYIINHDVYGLFLKIFDSLYMYFYLIYDNYGFWIIFFFFGLYFLKRKLSKGYYFFFLIFFTLTWIQILISFRHKTYMTSDLMVIIYPVATVGFFYLLENIKSLIFKKYILILVVISISTSSIMAYVNFPLIHPYDQPAKNQNLMNSRLDELVN